MDRTLDGIREIMLHINEKAGEAKIEQLITFVHVLKTFFSKLREIGIVQDEQSGIGLLNALSELSSQFQASLPIAEPALQGSPPSQPPNRARNFQHICLWWLKSVIKIGMLPSPRQDPEEPRSSSSEGVAKSEKTFHYFNNLPEEIRRVIWKNALMYKQEYGYLYLYPTHTREDGDVEPVCIYAKAPRALYLRPR